MGISEIKFEFDTNNNFYSSTNGVLFNKDKTVLLQYPVAKSGTVYIVPNSVAIISESAFYACKLTNITISNSVTQIEHDAFEECRNLTNITVDVNNTIYSSIDGVLFNKDKTILIKYPIKKADTTYRTPSSVIYVDQKAFEDCSTLTNVEISYLVEEIGYMAFSQCLSLESVTLGNSVTLIDTQAFFNCPSLASVKIGNSVAYIGSSAFYNCHNLINVYFNGHESEWNNIYITSGNDPLINATIHFVTPLTSTSFKTLTSTYKFYIECENALENEMLAVACYDENGRILYTKPVECDGDNEYIASVPKDTNIKNAKVFLWSDYTNLSPLGISEKVQIN